MLVNKFGQRESIVTDDAILGFFGEYQWLSNFEVLPNPIGREVNGEVYYFTSSEAYYMSCKSDSVEYLEMLTEATPAQARRLGTQITLREDWDRRYRFASMFDAVLKKFTFNELLRAKLVLTENKYLEESNNWGDKYWGVVNGEGLGNLGHVLMAVRSVVKCT